MLPSCSVSPSMPEDHREAGRPPMETRSPDRSVGQLFCLRIILVEIQPLKMNLNEIISSWFNWPTKPHDSQASVLNGTQCHRFALARAARELAWRDHEGRIRMISSCVGSNGYCDANFTQRNHTQPYSRILSHDMKQSTQLWKTKGQVTVTSQRSQGCQGCHSRSSWN